MLKNSKLNFLSTAVAKMAELRHVRVVGGQKIIKITEIGIYPEWLGVINEKTTDINKKNGMGV